MSIDRKLIRTQIIGTFSSQSFDDLFSLATLISQEPLIFLDFNDSDRIWSTSVAPLDAEKNLSSIYEYRLVDENDELIGFFRILGNNGKKFDEFQKQGLDLLAKLCIDRVEKKVSERIERKEILEAFEKQKEFMDAVLENMSEGIVACNAEGQLTVFNRATREFHGLDSRPDISPERWPEYYSLFHADGETIMHPDEVPLRRALRGEYLKNHEMVIESKDGGKINILCSGRSLINKDGIKLGAVCTMHNLTEIKKANAKAQATSKMLQALIDTCPVGIAVFDLDEKIHMWNPGSEAMLGWSKEEVLGLEMPYVDELHRLQVKETMQKVRSTKQQISAMRELYRKDRKKIDIQLSLLPLFDDQSELTGFMAVFLDISDVKEREINLLATNRALQAASVAKSEFLANMSHEIRTPLNGVIGMTDLVLMSDLNSEQREHLQVAQSSANNLLAIISDILDFSKIEAGKLDIENVGFNAEKLLHDVYETVRVAAKSKDITLIKKISPSPLPVLNGDPSRIRQVLLNLVSNAIKFSESGEVLTSISLTENSGSGRVRLRIEVIDHGVGISNSVLAKLFQPFSQADSSTTRRFGGTGLGLSISKRLVDLMNGEIGVESEVGNGSKFWVTLDLEKIQDAVEQIIPMEATLPNTVPKRFRVLLAEDNLINQKVVMKMLEKLGYQADVVDHGRAAVEALRGVRYDLVLMDCQMPEMDGYEATRMIRKDPKLPNNITIIATTANAMKGDREKCLESGMNDYIPKPIRLEALEEALAKYLIKI